MSSMNIVQVNYWKELRKELYETLGHLNGIVLVTHNSIWFSDVVDFLNLVRKDEHLKILYISLINSYKHIKEVLNQKNLENKELSYIDCVSGFLIELQDGVECTYRKPPKNLQAMKQLILQGIEQTQPHIILIDSLSQFINFSSPTDQELQELYSFLQTIQQFTMETTTQLVILLYDDKLGNMKKLPTMFTTLILKLEVIKEQTTGKNQ